MRAAFTQLAAAPPPGLPAAAAARLPGFIGGPLDAGDLLANLRVAFVGLGSLGGRLAVDLARLGPAAVWLCDHKLFKPESPITHDVGPDVIGQPKASTTGRRILAVSPRTRVSIHDGPVQTLPLDAFAEADVVVLASDNLLAEVHVAERCQRLRKPLLHVAVHGDSLTACVRVVGNASPAGPCLRCAFGLAEEEALNHETTFSCEGGRAGLAQAGLVGQPTRSVAALCALAAALAGQQLIRWALKLGEPVEDTCLEYNGYRNATFLARLTRNPACAAEHMGWTVARAGRPLAGCTPRELANLAGLNGAADKTALAVDGFVFVESAACGCATPSPVGRFVEAGQTALGPCSACGAARQPAPFFTRQSVPLRLLGGASERPLAALGAGDAACVLVRAGGAAVLLRQPDALESRAWPGRPRHDAASPGPPAPGPAKPPAILL
jgi:molybdopterin/thiamine biosynthesis adenylyltransferase